MKIIVDSLTGMGLKFAKSLNYPIIDINNYDVKDLDDDLFLVTRCFNFGEIPKSTIDFLELYHTKVIGVACGGNRNWGTNYGIAGDKIQEIYNIPHVTKFEAAGFPNEREKVKLFLANYERK